MHAGRGSLDDLLDHVSGPLVVLLQEANEDDVRRASERRRLSFFFAPVREGPEISRGNAIVATMPLLNPRRIPLPRVRQPRNAVAADVELGRMRLFVASAHLENRVSWWRGGLFSDGGRGAQARALIAALPEGPGILGGDMNTWLGTQEPAWLAFRQRFADTPSALQPTFRDRLVLDHLFFDLPEGWRATAAVDMQSFGSDHHPVIGALQPSYSLDEKISNSRD